MILISFNNISEVLKKFFLVNWSYGKYIIMADISKALKWNLIEWFIDL